MKKIAALMMAIAMTFSLAMTASAADVVDDISSYEEAVASGYDDYLTEAVTRGTSVPSASKVWDFNDGKYEGFLNNIRTGIYTNYCFYPNSDGELTFGWNVKGNQSLDGASAKWKVLVGIYDMSGKYIVETKGGSFCYDYGIFHKGSVTFADLDPDTKYCFFISVYDGACQIYGDCWVSD